MRAEINGVSVDIVPSDIALVSGMRVASATVPGLPKGMVYGPFHVPDGEPEKEQYDVLLVTDEESLPRLIHRMNSNGPTTGKTVGDA